jgi:hypothetical protein
MNESNKKHKAIGIYRIKEERYHCFYFQNGKYAVAEKTVGSIGTGQQVCRVKADSTQGAKQALEQYLNDSVGENGHWEK